MIYKLEFILEDIKNRQEDSYELHFRILNEDEKIKSILSSKDFIFLLENEWIVAANDKNIISNFNCKWYIRGSRNSRQGNKSYFNKTIDKPFFKIEFNKELLDMHPLIKDKIHKGEFNVGNNTMKIN